MKIYVASSWRNQRQPAVVKALTQAGFDAYDFRQPKSAFAWSEIDTGWAEWTGPELIRALGTPKAQAGFRTDLAAMHAADVCVLVLPCGRSAHMEAGWFVGEGRPLIILLDTTNEPELMYKLATTLCTEIAEVVRTVQLLEDSFV